MEIFFFIYKTNDKWKYPGIRTEKKLHQNPGYTQLPTRRETEDGYVNGPRESAKKERSGKFLQFNSSKNKNCQ